MHPRLTPPVSAPQLLLWAGEANSNKRYGTVDGAMDSGENEAYRIIDYMDANA